MEALEVVASQRLARMLVAIWMCAVAATQRAAAYELLAKLCTQQLVACREATLKSTPAEAAGLAAGAAEDSPEKALSACALLLVEAVAYRNEYKLPADGWGTRALGNFEDPSLAGLSAHELRTRLAPLTTQRLSTESTRALDSLAAMLPLL